MSNEEKSLQKTTINWFPGHMSKATREIKEKIDLVDILIELIDARAPLASRNPLIESINKKRIIVLTKADMADPSVTLEWKQYFNDLGINVLILDLKEKIDTKVITSACEDIMKEKIEKDKKRGIRPRPIRAMVVGIPNVGKSTFINKISGRKATSVANKPGHTKAQQWVKNENVELLDTPGILWPKFEDQRDALKLALIGSIKIDILDSRFLATNLLKFLTVFYPNEFEKRYNFKCDVKNEDEAISVFEQIALNRGFLVNGGHPDLDKAVDLILREFKDNVIGRCSLERPGRLWLD